MPVASPHGYRSAPLGRHFKGMAGKRLLRLVGIGMLVFGAAEVPALARMSSHGTGVLGFEFAASTHRMHEILTRWGSVGRAGAQQEVLIDLGFILCYGLLLAGSCGRLARRFEKDGHARTATVAVLLAWAALLAAAANALQKVVLTLELHGHIAQPLPALSTVCAAITFTLAVSAALFVTGGTIAVRRSRRTAAAEGRA
jgi:hypothetical protein